MNDIIQTSLTVLSKNIQVSDVQEAGIKPSNAALKKYANLYTLQDYDSDLKKAYPEKGAFARKNNETDGEYRSRMKKAGFHHFHRLARSGAATKRLNSRKKPKEEFDIHRGKKSIEELYEPIQEFVIEEIQNILETKYPRQTIQLLKREKGENSVLARLARGIKILAANRTGPMKLGALDLRRRYGDIAVTELFDALAEYDLDSELLEAFVSPAPLAAALRIGKNRDSSYPRKKLTAAQREQRAKEKESHKMETQWQSIKRDIHGEPAREPRKVQNVYRTDIFGRKLKPKKSDFTYIPGKKAYPKKEKPFPEGMFENYK